MNKKINSVRCSSLALRAILITDNVHQIMIETFEKSGYTCDYFPDYNSDQVLNSIEKYVGIIINSKTKIFRKEIDRAKKLKFIGRLGSGMEIIDVEYAKSKGIKSFSVPEANCDAVGEHAIGMLLSLFNNLNNADKEVRNFQWNREKNRGIELGGKIVAIIGYGHTGKAFAKKLSGFNVEVLVYDKYLKNYTDNFAKEATMQEIYKKADVVSFHLPLTYETNQLCDEKYITNFKKDIFIINTSRGKVLNLKNIFFQLKSKKILGMCLDVFENEKLNTFSTDEKKLYTNLYDVNSVILSPHVAGWTIESKFKIAKMLVSKILKSFN